MYPGKQYARPSQPPPQYQYQQYAQQQFQPPQGPPPQAYGYSPAQAPPQAYGYSQPAQASSRGYSQPPQGPQAFGTEHVQYNNFQYSQCTGRRKALLIGINYIGTRNELRGCINDANAMQRFLCDRYGYKTEDIVLLSDDQQQLVKVPTRANIIRAMQWLVKDARPNDSLVFHYSGHGGQEKNLTGDEETGYDSCIYPVDFEASGSIIDDVMHDIMVRPLPQGCRLTALFDSCHSGSALDLPYVYSTKGIIKEPNMLKDVGGFGLNAVMSYATGNYGGLFNALEGAVKTVSQGGSYNRQAAIAKNASPADVIMFSGSKDTQTSADASENGTATGAMSFAFISALCKQPNQSYLSLLNCMRDELAGKYTQKPQLSASHPIDVNLQFIM